MAPPAPLRAPHSSSARSRAAGTRGCAGGAGRHGREERGWIRLRTPRRELSPQHLKRQRFFFFLSLFFLPSVFTPSFPFSSSPHLFLSPCPTCQALYSPPRQIRGRRSDGFFALTAACATRSRTNSHACSRAAPLRERCHEAAQPAGSEKGWDNLEPEFARDGAGRRRKAPCGAVG